MIPNLRFGQNNAVNLKYGYKILEIRNPRDLTDEK